LIRQNVDFVENCCDRHIPRSGLGFLISPAAKDYGLQGGDVTSFVDDLEVHSEARFRDAVAKTKSGDQISTVIKRNGEIIVINWRHYGVIETPAAQ